MNGCNSMKRPVKDQVEPVTCDEDSVDFGKTSLEVNFWPCSYKVLFRCYPLYVGRGRGSLRRRSHLAHRIG